MPWENSSDRKFGQKVSLSVIRHSYPPPSALTNKSVFVSFFYFHLALHCLVASSSFVASLLIALPLVVSPPRHPSPHCLAPRHPSPPQPCPSHCFRCLIKKVPRVDSSHTPLAPTPHRYSYIIITLVITCLLITLTRPHHTHSPFLLLIITSSPLLTHHHPIT